MARYGVLYLMCGKRQKDAATGAVTYTEGIRAADIITLKATWETADAPLYAGNRIKENSKDFVGGALEMNTDNLSFAVRAYMLGQKVSKETMDGKQVEHLVGSVNDEAPILGVGFIGTDMVDGKRKYHGVFLPMVQFGVPGMDMKTMEKNVSWQTPTISGTVMIEDDGNWIREIYTGDEATAVAWLKDMVGYVAPATDSGGQGGAE